MDARWPFVPRSCVDLWRVKQEPDAGAGGDVSEAGAGGGLSEAGAGGGVSEAAARAGLYAGHEVKDELMLGPHTVQQRPFHNTHAAPHQVLEVKQEPSSEVVGREHELRERTVVAALITSNTRGTEDRDSRATTVNAAGVEWECRDTTATNVGGHDGAPHPVQELKQEPSCEVVGRGHELRECRVVLERVAAALVTGNTRGTEDQSERRAAVGNVGEDYGVSPLVPAAAAASSSYECDTCGRVLTRRQTLIRHIRLHKSGKIPFSCATCGKQYTTKSGLFRHTQTHSGQKLHACDICNKKFSQKSSLNTHTRSHTGIKPFSCDICKKQFTESHNLTKHKRIHTGDKPFACNICNKQFSRSDYLTAHRRIHTGDKPYSCEICSKKFSQASNLSKHRHSHTGNKPFCCEICQKYFSLRTNLNKHKRIHTGDKPFSCNICNKQFSHPDYLTAHFKRIHRGY